MWPLVALFLLLAGPAMAQPADCTAAPPTGPVMELGVNLAGRPGVPKGTSGKVYPTLPAGAPAGNDCQDEPAKPLPDALRGEPGNVLGGAPGNVLGGPPSPDLLRGPGHPHVTVEEVR